VEGKIQDRVLDYFIIMVDFLEIVKSGLFDEIVAFDPVYRVEEWDL